MNLQRPNANDATLTGNRSRSVVPQSGLCSRCVDGCKGNCEVFKASFRGRELLYPGPYGAVTAGGDKEFPVDYSHIHIQGYAQGAKGIPDGNPDTATFPAVDTETAYGAGEDKVKMKVPIFTGALGSTEVARRNWDGFAVGAALAGISLVCGENVCGIDPDLELKNGKVVESPDMRRRVETYQKWRQGYGDIHVQMNVEDTRLGVAEYVIDKLGATTIELKWGQGAKCIGGEIKVDSLERALELQSRGYIVTPDPSLKINQEAFKEGGIKQFERHSRLGFIDEDDFYNEVQRLRSLGAKRVSLKTGAYGLIELAKAIRWSSNAKIDLLTIDGSGGGTGMSPWRMMNEWGVPTFHLQSLTQEFCEKLAQSGAWVPDIAIAGGFSAEDHLFKVLAMGAPYTKAICMGRALMIPGMVGKNIGEWMAGGGLPSTVKKFGETVEEIFISYEAVKDLVGGDAISDVPLGAIGVYTFCDKLKVGLQQIMAGSRNFKLDTITRGDLFALTKDAADISGLPYVMDAGREAAMLIIEGNGLGILAKRSRWA